MQSFAVVLGVLLLAAPLISAGDYRGRPHKEAPEDWLSYNPSPSPLLEAGRLPKSFNWCNLPSFPGENMCTTAWNQHIPIYCGSCWAHGTLSMVQDRLKIKKKGKGPDVMLSRQTLLNCAAFKGMGAGCDGGDVFDAFKYMTDIGLPDESCYTYNATDHLKYGPDAKECPADGVCRNCMPLGPEGAQVDTCWAVETPILYKLSSYGKIPKGSDHRGEHAMMSEIYQRGPVTCSIATPDDLVYNYHSGVYRDNGNTTEDDVDHDIEVVGWGHEHGRDFWLIRNSWGTFWGEMGFFKLERGVNALFIEEGDCWYAEPEYDMEIEVENGDLVGSMYGVIDPSTIPQNLPGADDAAAGGSGISRAVAAATRAAAAAWAKLRPAFFRVRV